LGLAWLDISIGNFRKKEALLDAELSQELRTLDSMEERNDVIGHSASSCPMDQGYGELLDIMWSILIVCALTFPHRGPRLFVVLQMFAWQEMSLCSTRS
jgi:hypothetical protein